MRIDKSDALLLRSIIFNFIVNDDSGIQRDELDDLLSRIDEYVLSSSHESTDAQEDESEDVLDVKDEDDNDAESSKSAKMSVPSHDASIEASVLHNLQPTYVTLPNGEKVSLEFEDNDDYNAVSVLENEGENIVEGIKHIRIADNEIEVYSDDECCKYTYKNIPKSWRKVLEVGKTYCVSSSGG